MPLSHGVIKINFDGSFFDVNAGPGFGFFLFSQAEPDICGSAEAVECWATGLGLLKAWDLGDLGLKKNYA